MIRGDRIDDGNGTDNKHKYKKRAKGTGEIFTKGRRMQDFVISSQSLILIGLRRGEDETQNATYHRVTEFRDKPRIYIFLLKKRKRKEEKECIHRISESKQQGRTKQGLGRRKERGKKKRRYRLLESGEVNGQGAFVFSRAKRSHGDVGDGRNHHVRGEAVEEHRHEQVVQPRRRQFLHSLPSPSPTPTQWL